MSHLSLGGEEKLPPTKDLQSPKSDGRVPKRFNVGYVCWNEKEGSPSCIVWFDKYFYRIPLTPPLSLSPPRPLTPVVFTSSLVYAKPLGKNKIPTYHAEFQQILHSGDTGFSSPPRILGTLTKNSPTNVTFNLLPSKSLISPIKASFLSSSLPKHLSLPFNVEVGG